MITPGIHYRSAKNIVPLVKKKNVVVGWATLTVIQLEEIYQKGPDTIKSGINIGSDITSRIMHKPKQQIEKYTDIVLDTMYLCQYECLSEKQIILDKRHRAGTSCRSGWFVINLKILL